MRHKMVLFNAIILTVTLFIVSLLLYSNQKAYILNSSNEQMQLYLQDMVDLLDLQIKEKQLQVDLALDVARDQLLLNGELRRDSVGISIEATNQETKEVKEVEIYSLYSGDIPFYNDFDIVDKVQNLTGQTATLFQKIEGGYLRVSTNVRKLDGTRAVGTYIPQNSPVIQTVEQGRTFKGRAFVVNDWYLTAYEPIRYNNEIVGILYVGVKEKDLNYLKEKFYEKHYLTSGYPYAITHEGELLIHPFLENESVANEKWFGKMTRDKKGMVANEWGSKNEDEAMMHYFINYDAFDMTLAIAVPKAELIDAPLNELRNIIFGGLIIILAILLTLISIFVNRQMAPLLVINEQLHRVSQRKDVEPLTMDREDEIGTINNSLNQVIAGNESTTKFAEAIGEHKFDVEFKALSEEDVLGQALLGMRKSLKASAEENKQRSWINQGHNLLNSIIRANQDTITGLCKAFLPELVRYTDACQSGIYIHEQEGNHQYLVLRGAYAWGQHKHVKHKMEIDEELSHSMVDQVFLEGKSILLKGLPDNYVNITSGLGSANPNHIIILPLLYNDDVLGVLEIASFNEITKVVEEFLTQTAENLAASIASLTTATKTKLLLAETQNKTSELASMEEEVRQNLEEMQATNEEMNRKEKEYLTRIEELENEIKKLKE
ncbi:Cache 3/Cache 2 fusion domain-containing protein [Fulvivirga maritima]|uniref:Cache 3/Cache 2 fusion domain-containing protein n=1 Tax=Fulvivirga maritima TaxID=2904247 RepID=UPI001F21476F|nr:Cache 3/Cache 2 fusion domain-containing protein [Fulvivirga maritima]UII25531.1 Cache 3/Cache 2 fusion domain-containing protein [Fulvivirga maritima]